MAQMAASAAREEFAEVLNRVAYGKERIVLQRHGKPLVAIIPVEDLQLLERLIEEEEDRIDVEEARRVLADPTEEEIPWEQIKAEADR
jgi:prevent-host-death family protein